LLSKREASALRDIATTCKNILRLTQGYDETSFVDDLRARSATTYEFVVMGEAVKRLNDEFRESHAEVSWGEIAGMRDVLVHQYHRIAWRLV
jgi:uncharacterized protein with HEPN domain